MHCKCKVVVRLFSEIINNDGLYLATCERVLQCPPTWVRGSTIHTSVTQWTNLNYECMYYVVPRAVLRHSVTRGLHATRATVCACTTVYTAMHACCHVHVCILPYNMYVYVYYVCVCILCTCMCMCMHSMYIYGIISLNALLVHVPVLHTCHHAQPNRVLRCS